MPQLQTQQLQYANNSPVNVLVTARSQIPYIELTQYDETFRQDGVEATRVCACRWDDRVAFVKDMLGGSAYQQGAMVGGQTSNLHRDVPEQHPDLTFLYASECALQSGQGVPPTDTSDIAKALSSSVDYSSTSTADSTSYMVKWSLAVYRVKYTTRMYTIYSDEETPADNQLGELGRFVVKQYQMAAQNLSVPGGKYKWVDNPQNPPPTPTPIMEPGVKIFGSLNVSYTWVQVPQIPYATIEATVGKTNCDTFDTFYAPGTLICLAPEITPYYTATGTLVFDIKYLFEYRASGVNFLYRGADAGPDINSNNTGFQEASKDGMQHKEDGMTPQTGVHIYDSIQFAKLFTL